MSTATLYDGFKNTCWGPCHRHIVESRKCVPKKMYASVLACHGRTRFSESYKMAYVIIEQVITVIFIVMYVYKEINEK